MSYNLPSDWGWRALQNRSPFAAGGLLSQSAPVAPPAPTVANPRPHRDRDGEPDKHDSRGSQSTAGMGGFIDAGMLGQISPVDVVAALAPGPMGLMAKGVNELQAAGIHGVVGPTNPSVQAHQQIGPDTAFGALAAEMDRVDAINSIGSNTGFGNTGTPAGLSNPGQSAHGAGGGQNSGGGSSGSGGTGAGQSNTGTPDGVGNPGDAAW